MGMAAPTYYTADMVRALPDDGNRYEVVHGELLVTPSPGVAHQWVIRRLLLRLGNYLEAHPHLQVFTSPADISWAPDTLVQPDIFVAPTEQVRTLDWKFIKTLLLAIEVLSPSTRRYDRFTKRRAYQEFDVPTYWVVDIENRAVEVWAPAATTPVVERKQVTWHPAGVGEPLVISLAEVFEGL
jgi:Uma2 family endonuclease